VCKSFHRTAQGRRGSGGHPPGCTSHGDGEEGVDLMNFTDEAPTLVQELMHRRVVLPLDRLLVLLACRREPSPEINLHALEFRRGRTGSRSAGRALHPD
jgi:hypothetical protein